MELLRMCWVQTELDIWMVFSMLDVQMQCIVLNRVSQFLA